MMQTVLIIHEVYSKICHSLWYDTESGVVMQYSTDEGDTVPWTPIDIVMVSKENNKNAYVLDPNTNEVRYNVLTDVEVLKIEFSTMKLPGVPPIGDETLCNIIKSGILN